MSCAIDTATGFNMLEMGIGVSIKLIGGAYIDVMRNEAIIDMLMDPNCIGTLMVDHDAVWPNSFPSVKDGVRNEGFNALYQLYKQDKDIVGALTTTRQMPIRLMCGTYTNDGQIAFLNDLADGHPRNGKMFKVDWTACHFTYVSRRGAIKIAQHYGSEKSFFESGTRIRHDDKNKTRLLEVMEQFKLGHIEREEAFERAVHAFDLAGVYQEDISFCQRAQAAGCEIWIDPCFEVQHIGDYAYSRVDWLGQKGREEERAQAEAEAAEKATPLSVVK